MAREFRIEIPFWVSREIKLDLDYLVGMYNKSDWVNQTGNIVCHSDIVLHALAKFLHRAFDRMDYSKDSYSQHYLRPPVKKFPEGQLTINGFDPQRKVLTKTVIKRK